MSLTKYSLIYSSHTGPEIAPVTILPISKLGGKNIGVAEDYLISNLRDELALYIGAVPDKYFLGFTEKEESNDFNYNTYLESLKLDILNVFDNSYRDFIAGDAHVYHTYLAMVNLSIVGVVALKTSPLTNHVEVIGALATSEYENNLDFANPEFIISSMIKEGIRDVIIGNNKESSYDLRVNFRLPDQLTDMKSDTQPATISKVLDICKFKYLQDEDDTETGIITWQYIEHVGRRP